MTIQTKYNIGETVWLVYLNQIIEGQIIGIVYTKGHDFSFDPYPYNGIITYQLKDVVYKIQEKDLFKTRQELLNKI